MAAASADIAAPTSASSSVLACVATSGRVPTGTAPSPPASSSSSAMRPARRMRPSYIAFCAARPRSSFCSSVAACCRALLFGSTRGVGGRSVQRVKVMGHIEVSEGETRSGLSMRVSGLSMRVSGLGTRVSGLSMRVSGLAIRVSGLAMRVSGLFMRVSGLAMRVSGLAMRVSGLSMRVSGLSMRVSELSMRVSGLAMRVSGSGLETDEWVLMWVWSATESWTGAKCRHAHRHQTDMSTCAALVHAWRWQ
eukprot:353127-Chlamydomonas_euryale.AAC.3